MKRKAIYVTKTYLPTLSEYVKYLKRIWKSGWITNHGPLVNLLEKKLKKYLSVKNLFIVSNGTIGLQISIKALDIKGEIITTPFTYIATTSSIIWENCKPVFVDIDPETFCLDANKIESAITKNTKAIVAVHVFGVPCDVEKIEKISKRFHLKVIYDAAHAFGVTYKGKSLLSFGDISILSFHAAKIFHSAEGGAIICKKNIAKRIAFMRNFGHKGYDKDFHGLGINGKNSELHAAMGLSVLPKINTIIKKRKNISQTYDAYFKKTTLRKTKISSKIKYNYGYYPIVFKSETELLRVKNALNKNHIYPRRYFYPSLNTIDYVKKFHKEYSCPISESISKRILCLPLFYDLNKSDIKRISKIVLENI